MANFSTPLGAEGERRLPTETEREQGFLCGPADRTLFTGLFHRIESELGDVMQHAGIAGNDGDNTQLRQAILALIAAATGGNPAGYILESQARARLPIFPEVETADGRIPVISPVNGTVRLPAGFNFLHRGIFQVTTVQTDFPTDPSKTYHLRWDPVNGYRLRDVASAAYNPGGLQEASVTFDSKYDDILIARVVTNSSNIATITNLANKNRLVAESPEIISDAGTYTYGTPQDALEAAATYVYNWARVPIVSVNAAMLSTHARGHQGVANWITAQATTRYSSYAHMVTDYDNNIFGDGIAHGRFRFYAMI